MKSSYDQRMFYCRQEKLRGLKVAAEGRARRRLLDRRRLAVKPKAEHVK